MKIQIVYNYPHHLVHAEDELLFAMCVSLPEYYLSPILTKCFVKLYKIIFFLDATSKAECPLK